jgi:hypothetical protein
MQAVSQSAFVLDQFGLDLRVRLKFGGRFEGGDGFQFSVFSFQYGI